MKRRITQALLTLLALLVAVGVNAQGKTSGNARAILDKVAKNVNRPSGATADFKLSGDGVSSSGTIAIKGNKFRATTPEGVVWFDGKTQWTYMKNNEEVNVNTPNAKQQARMNPYYFITLYKKGYNMTSKAVGGGYEVHLTAQGKNQALQEIYITVNKSYLPTKVRFSQKGKWTTITVSNFKAAKLSDSSFTFKEKDYPNAEVIDLR